MKHKHYECIIAWANGETIQTLQGDGKWGDREFPLWSKDMCYRIKPEPRPQWQQNLIDAVKSGKIVEFYDVIAGWAESDLNKQLDLYNFGYATQSDYRIRPTKVTRYQWAYKNTLGNWYATCEFKTEQEAAEAYSELEYIKLEYPATELEE